MPSLEALRIQLALGLLTYTSLRSEWGKVPPSWEEAQEESWRKLSVDLGKVSLLLGPPRPEVQQGRG